MRPQSPRSLRNAPAIRDTFGEIGSAAADIAKRAKESPDFEAALQRLAADSDWVANQIVIHWAMGWATRGKPEGQPPLTDAQFTEAVNWLMLAPKGDSYKPGSRYRLAFVMTHNYWAEEWAKHA